MKFFFKNNGLSIVFFLLFVISYAGQVYTGYHVHNNELKESGAATVSILSYASSGHLIQATFENWESEFLQMALFVILTVFLKQKGSSESKDFKSENPVDKEPRANKKHVPWPVKKGGIILKLYKHSLSVALLILFIVSFVLHFYGSLKDENNTNLIKGIAAVSGKDYLLNSRFWFESFQNWQSEFLSVFTLVVLSIYLRQIGSPQSKAVDDPQDKTGE